MKQHADISVDVQQLFSEAEIKAERLISWLRIGISITLFLSFIFALGTSDVSFADTISQDRVRRVQALYAVGAIAAFFLLGALCLVLIHFRWFRRWMVWPSACGDCLYILSGVWLGFRTTGLTSDYLASLPTLWLIPVVLATGVLRFNPRVQLFTLIVLMGGVGLIASQFPTLTRASVDALDVFFAQPPNIIRFVMGALAGGVMILATWRMRVFFLRTLQEAQQRVNLTRYVPAEVAADLARSGLSALGGGSRQEVVVMFIDIRGFTSRSEGMSPEELSEFVTRYRSHVTQAARENGGIVDKFIGDAVMLIFTDQDAENHAAARAIACGKSVLDRLNRWSQTLDDPVKVGIGLHLGDVFAGVIGDGERLEYSVFGDVVNVASRLEGQTKEAGVDMIASDTTLSAAGEDRNGWVNLPDLVLRGKSKPLTSLGWRLD